MFWLISPPHSLLIIHCHIHVSNVFFSKTIYYTSPHHCRYYLKYPVVYSVKTNHTYVNTLPIQTAPKVLCLVNAISPCMTFWLCCWKAVMLYQFCKQQTGSQSPSPVFLVWHVGPCSLLIYCQPFVPSDMFILVIRSALAVLKNIRM